MKSISLKSILFWAVVVAVIGIKTVGLGSTASGFTSGANTAGSGMSVVVNSIPDVFTGFQNTSKVIDKQATPKPTTKPKP